MIYTLTLNPSLDYFVDVPRFSLGSVNRSLHELLFPGGKGINVSIVLSRLGIQNTALGFIAGDTGRLFEDMLASFDVKSDFVHLSSGDTRINVKINAGNETEINARGPQITHRDVGALLSVISSLKDGDTLIISGSVPPQLSDTVYADIASSISAKNVNMIVDTTGKYLTNILKYKPFMIKPNHIELGEIFGRTLVDDNEIIACAKKLQADGAQNVLVSKGADGAILVCADGTVCKAYAPRGNVISTVGAGDSAVAGFVAGFMQKSDFGHALKLAVSAGSATSFCHHLATEDEIMRIYANC